MKSSIHLGIKYLRKRFWIIQTAWVWMRVNSQTFILFTYFRIIFVISSGAESIVQSFQIEYHAKLRVWWSELDNHQKLSNSFSLRWFHWKLSTSSSFQNCSNFKREFLLEHTLSAEFRKWDWNCDLWDWRNFLSFKCAVLRRRTLWEPLVHVLIENIRMNSRWKTDGNDPCWSLDK